MENNSGIPGQNTGKKGSTDVLPFFVVHSPSATRKETLQFTP